MRGEAAADTPQKRPPRECARPRRAAAAPFSPRSASPKPSPSPHSSHLGVTQNGVVEQDAEEHEAQEGDFLERVDRRAEEFFVFAARGRPRRRGGGGRTSGQQGRGRQAGRQGAGRRELWEGGEGKTTRERTIAAVGLRARAGVWHAPPGDRPPSWRAHGACTRKGCGGGAWRGRVERARARVSPITFTRRAANGAGRGSARVATAGRAVRTVGRRACMVLCGGGRGEVEKRTGRGRRKSLESVGEQQNGEPHCCSNRPSPPPARLPPPHHGRRAASLASTLRRKREGYRLSSSVRSSTHRVGASPAARSSTPAVSSQGVGRRRREVMAVVRSWTLSRPQADRAAAAESRASAVAIVFHTLPSASHPHRGQSGAHVASAPNGGQGSPHAGGREKGGEGGLCSASGCKGERARVGRVPAAQT